MSTDRVLSDIAPTVCGMDELTAEEESALAFEHGRWIHAGAKDEAILKTFGLTPARYQQWLLAIIDRPTALVHDPVLVLRLRRLRDQRRSVRTGRRRRTG